MGDFWEPNPDDEEELYADDVAIAEDAINAEYEASKGPTRALSTHDFTSKSKRAKTESNCDSRYDARIDSAEPSNDQPPPHWCKECGATCAVVTSRSERNPNRKYYKCQPCDYFKWCDQPTLVWSEIPSAPGEPAPHHECATCGEPCAVKTSRSANNPNRQYFKCGNCGYFKWCDTVQSCGPPSGHFGREATSTSAARGENFAGTTGNCYLCKQPGHFARECPNTNGDVATVQTGTRLNRNCYKCNQPGHFARDCPNARISGGDSAGVGKSCCYKCQQPGHFARDCTNQVAQAGNFSSRRSRS